MKSPCLHYHGPGKPCEFLQMGSRTISDLCRTCKPGNEYKKHVEGNARNPFPDGMTYAKGKHRMEKEITTPQVQIKKDPHEDLVLELCKKLGISLKQLRGKTTREISAARMEIIKELSSIDGLTYKTMGELIGVSEKIVGYYFRKIKANVVKYAMADLAYKEVVSHVPERLGYDIIYNPHAENPDDEIKLRCKLTGEIVPFAPDPPKDANNYLLEIDFSNHPDVFTDLVEMAARDLRDPDKQALFILRHIYEKGLKVGEADETIN